MRFDVPSLAVLGGRKGEQGVWQQQVKYPKDRVQGLGLCGQEVVGDVVVGVVIVCCCDLCSAAETRMSAGVGGPLRLPPLLLPPHQQSNAHSSQLR